MSVFALSDPLAYELLPTTNQQIATIDNELKEYFKAKLC